MHLAAGAPACMHRCNERRGRQPARISSAWRSGHCPHSSTHATVATKLTIHLVSGAQQLHMTRSTRQVASYAQYVERFPLSRPPKASVCTVLEQFSPT